MDGKEEIKFQFGDRFSMKQAEKGIEYVVVDVDAAGNIALGSCGTRKGTAGTYRAEPLNQHLDRATFVRPTFARPAQLYVGDVIVANMAQFSEANVRLEVEAFDNRNPPVLRVISEIGKGKVFQYDSESYWLAAMTAYEPGPEALRLDAAVKAAAERKAINDLWEMNAINMTRGYVRDLVKRQSGHDTVGLINSARDIENYLCTISAQMGLEKVALKDIGPVGLLAGGFSEVAERLFNFIMIHASPSYRLGCAGGALSLLSYVQSAARFSLVAVGPHAPVSPRQLVTDLQIED